MCWRRTYREDDLGEAEEDGAQNGLGEHVGGLAGGEQNGGRVGLRARTRRLLIQVMLFVAGK